MKSKILTDRQLLGKTLKESVKTKMELKAITEALKNKPTTDWYSKKEAAKYVELSERQLDRYRTSGKIKSYQTTLNGKVRFKKSDLDKFLNGK